MDVLCQPRGVSFIGEFSLRKVVGITWESEERVGFGGNADTDEG